MGPVCSWNEWDPLEEVIVGTARGAAEIGYEPSLSCYFPPDSAERRAAGGAVPQALVDEAERQLDAFAALLAERGIVVHRPDPMDHAVPFRTPDWEVSAGRAAACPRDLLLVVGDTIVEAPMAQRARFFEYRAYRRLMRNAFDAGARWIAAPKPIMAGDLYVEGEARLSEAEPAFDAACFARFGRDLFWQPDMVSNAAGAEWLSRALGPDFRLHEVSFDEAAPMHIDTSLVPVRPGLVLVNPERPCTNGGLDLFRRDGWQIVPAPPSVRSGKRRAGGVSSWISMNILMLDPHTAVVEAAEKPTIDLLESLGCTVIPCAFDRVYGFGGSFHCCTCDLRRDGKLESCFPSLD
ncbi:MAG TPA: serine/threonine protein kinase [Allosphingosinicella sp.]